MREITISFRFFPRRSPSRPPARPRNTLMLTNRRTSDPQKRWGNPSFPIHTNLGWFQDPSPQQERHHNDAIVTCASLQQQSNFPRFLIPLSLLFVKHYQVQDNSKSTASWHRQPRNRTPCCRLLQLRTPSWRLGIRYLLTDISRYHSTLTSSSAQRSRPVQTPNDEHTASRAPRR
jgi:hypothetical protein